MAAEKTLALITRVIEFSESSCIVTLFTEDFGKIAALAKGARRPKSAFEGAIDLLALIRLVFLRKSGDVLDLLTEARLERRFRSASRDLGRLYAGYYVAELLNEMTDNGDPHPELFREANRALEGLDKGENVEQLVLHLEWTALRVLGHSPSLRRCSMCGEDVGSPSRVAFGLMAGGVLCPRCRVGQRSIVSLSAVALAELRRYAEFWGTGGGMSELTPPNPLVRGEIRGVMNQYLANLWGRRPRMQRYLGNLAH